MPIQNQILDLVELCSIKGIEQVIICPGSRNAPLTIAFTSHPNFKCYSISDERSAAYIALGMAQESKKTVILICTSGTAALNFAPAVAEATFLEVPLLVITADRPSQWINQYDGQTIYQENLYGKNVKKSYNLVAERDSKEIEWYFNRVLNESINLCNANPKGPVHVNIPISEPFYPESTETISFREVSNITQFGQSKILSEPENNYIHSKLNIYKSIIVIVGQQFDLKLEKSLETFAKNFKAAIISEKISNVTIDDQITESELIFTNTFENLNPDLVITVGMSTISKRIKNYFRKQRIKEHWHIQENPNIMDPFMNLNLKIEIEPDYFFSSINQNFKDTKLEELDPLTILIDKNSKSKVTKNNYLDNSKHSDLKFLFEFNKILKQNSIIHLGNSLSVRYYNYLDNNRFIKKYYCNRGTSGIDGIVSTALGQAINSETPMICILGDVSFQYDKNAIWNNYLPKNFKIIILNNEGGNIFKMIDGPKNQKAHDEFFKTFQTNSAALLSLEFGLDYFKINSIEEYNQINEFLANNNKPSILEVFTDPMLNEQVLKNIN